MSQSNSQSKEILQELLNKMIEREEQLPEIIENAPIIEGETYLDLPNFPKIKVYKSKNEAFFIFKFLEVIECIFAPEQMINFITHVNPDWGQSLKKEIKEQREKNPHITLDLIILSWLDKHPKIEKNLLQDRTYHYIKKTIGYDDVQDGPFNLIEPLPELDERSLCFIFLGNRFNCRLVRHEGTDFVGRLMHQEQHKVLSYFDQMLILSREELGVHSWKEVENMESAICYMIYRDDWLHYNNMWLDDTNINKLKAKKKKEFFPYFKKNPDKTIYEYLCDTGGFDGELWTSYEEFLHDEWLKDDLEFINHSDKELYYNLRRIALQKEG